MCRFLYDFDMILYIKGLIIEYFIIRKINYFSTINLIVNNYISFTVYFFPIILVLLKNYLIKII